MVLDLFDPRQRASGAFRVHALGCTAWVQGAGFLSHDMLVETGCTDKQLSSQIIRHDLVDISTRMYMSTHKYEHRKSPPSRSDA